MKRGHKMSKTDAQYWDISWNPLRGCDKVSPGCRACWAEALDKRFYGGKYFDGQGPHFCPEVLDAPLHWRKGRKVFVCDLSDWLHEKVQPAWIDRMLEVMAACPQHTFLCLTKRIENYERKVYGVTPECGCRELGGGDYLPNLWNGVTAENQEWADKRIPALLQIPAAVQFVSLEPLLGPVSFHTKFMYEHVFGESGRLRRMLNWTIVGCERLAGNKAGRGCEDEWRWWSWCVDIVRQCQSAGVAVWVKQGPKHGKVTTLLEDFPQECRVREYPKARAV